LESRESNQPDPELTNSVDPQGPEPEPTLGQWFRQNGVMITLALGLVVFLYMKFDWGGLWAIAQVVIGLGFVIFFHELGHFLVAKWCDVHVQVFSVGFGPALPGCRFQWGETTYKLSVIPLGGYVQMVGQVDLDETSDGSEGDPRSYKNKSVWQRMAIISAGVTMNAILAVICFAVVFQGPGKDRPAGNVGTLDSSSPAYLNNVATGAVIKNIDGIENPTFEDLLYVVMSTTWHEKVEFDYQVPGGELKRIQLEPKKDKTDGRPLFGIGPPARAAFRQERFAPHGYKSPVWPGTSAAGVKDGFQWGDRIIGTGPEGGPVTELPLDPRKPGSDQRDYFVFAQRLRELAGKGMTIRVVRDEGGHEKQRDVVVPPAYHNVLGVRMTMGEVTCLRENSPASGKVVARDAEKKRPGDILQRVEVTEADGSTTTFLDQPALAAQVASAALLPPLAGLPGLELALAGDARQPVEARRDPMRLPDNLRRWAARLKAAGVPTDQWTVRLNVLRHNEPKEGITRDSETVQLTLRWDTNWQYQEVEPIYKNSPLAVPELGLAYQVKPTVAGVDAAGGGGLQPGDEIKEYRLHVLSEGGKENDEEWVSFDGDQWAVVFNRLQAPLPVVKMSFKVKRSNQGELVEIKEVRLRQDKTWPLADRGLMLDTDLRLAKADGFFEAVGMGFKDSFRKVKEVYYTLRGMVTGRISVSNLGGPLLIGKVAYQVARVDFWEFIFFLGLISINLAVINFLPIPVLDGGHMVFLIYEKVRGKPASEQVRVGATYAGLLLLASLMIFVFYLDISRFIRGG
jgi:regulator of sigma E protease